MVLSGLDTGAPTRLGTLGCHLFPVHIQDLHIPSVFLQVGTPSAILTSQ